MPIETPRGLPFSVDTWSSSSKLKRHHFLTHAHKDHLTGIASFFSFPVYCTRLTKTLVRRQFPQLEESLFAEIELGEYLLVKDPDGDFSVRVFDANHCPGAVMFLFEGEFGNILHTGDCRLSTDCLQNLPLKYINKKRGDSNLDYLFLDCTFGSCSIEIPSKKLAIQQVINCIWKHPNAPVVYLACDMLGQEDVLVQVAKSFGSRIYVDKINNPGCFHILSLVAADILSYDATCRFQLWSWQIAKFMKIWKFGHCGALRRQKSYGSGAAAHYDALDPRVGRCSVLRLARLESQALQCSTAPHGSVCLDVNRKVLIGHQISSYLGHLMDHAIY